MSLIGTGDGGPGKYAHYYELVIRGRTTLPPPEPIVTIKGVSYLKLLGVTFQDSPTNWDKHFDDLMERALKRMHILRVCKRNGYSVSDLDDLFKGPCSP